MSIPWDWSVVSGFVQEILSSTFIATAAGAVVAIGLTTFLLRRVLAAFGR